MRLITSWLSSFGILVLVTLTNCTTEIIQARAGLEGDYQLTGTVVTTVDGRVSTQPISGTLSVFAGSNNAYYFSERLVGSNGLSFLTQTTGDSFTITGTTLDYSVYQGITYFGRIAGTGLSRPTHIEYNRSASTRQVDYNLPNGEHLSLTKDIRKQVSILALKPE